jgi:hypothetical protein
MRPLVGLLGTIVLAGPTHADDVADAIAEGRAAYEAGRIPAAQDALQRALQRLAGQAAVLHTAALPAPLPGWRIQDTSVSGNAGLGGTAARTQVARSYVNAEGRLVTVGIVTGASMRSEVDRMLGGLTTGNPSSDERMRWVRVGRELASQTYDGTLRMFVGGQIIVVVDGSAGPGAILAYAEAVDFARLLAR